MTKKFAYIKKKQYLCSQNLLNMTKILLYILAIRFKNLSKMTCKNTTKN